MEISATVAKPGFNTFLGWVGGMGDKSGGL